MRYQERGIYGTVLACVPFLLADAFIVQRGVESSADGESSLITVLITLLLLDCWKKGVDCAFSTRGLLIFNLPRSL